MADSGGGKRKKKGELFSDPFKSHDEIMSDFFGGGSAVPDEKPAPGSDDIASEPEMEIPAVQQSATPAIPEETPVIPPTPEKPVPAEPAKVSEPEAKQSAIPAVEEHQAAPAPEPATSPESSPRPAPAPKPAAESADATETDFTPVGMLKTFLDEFEDQINQLDESLLALEKEPKSEEEINRAFRQIHNIKGAANLMGFKLLGSACHEFETVLDTFRKPDSAMPPELVNVFLELNDYLREVRASLVAGGRDDTIDPEPLVTKLTMIASYIEPSGKQNPAPELSQAIREPEPAKPLPAAPAAEAFSDAPGGQTAETGEAFAPEMVAEFIEEAREMLGKIDKSVIQFEEDPGNLDILNEIFRAMHSFKGVAGFFGFVKMQSVAHHAEDLLGKVRSKEFEPRPEVVDLILASTDALNILIAEVSGTGREKTDFASLVADLKKILAGDFSVGSHRSPAAKQAEPAKHTAPGTAPATAPSAEPSASQQKQMQQSAAAQSATEKITTIRVEVNRLDDLMNLVGELVLLRNRLNQFSSQLEENDDFTGISGQLSMLTGSLQAGVMRTRMLPVGNVFTKFNRVVRDLCRSLGKEADLVITGGETELDKNMIEAISDPLVHLIRNSVDHAIEMPDVRQKAGKPRRGTIELKALQDGNSILIEITDDGKGIDPEFIKRKSIEKGIITAEEAQHLPKRDALALIFKPGFSTAEKVTEVSGRGVGMDVVKTNIENLKGQIEIDSETGKGATITLRIPLTLAIISTLLCKAGNQKFAVPLSSVMETVKLDPAQIEEVRGNPLIRLRDEILPIVHLKKLFAIDAPDGEEVDIIVLQVGLKRMGLVVDSTIGQEEVLIKSLNVLEGIYEPRHISGATILGDGSVSLILDVGQIVSAAKLIDSADKAALGQTQSRAELVSVLLVDDGGDEQYGIELLAVEKIDTLVSARIEQVGGREVVKYGGDVLLLTRLPEITGYDVPGYLSELYLVIIKGAVAGPGAPARVGLIVNRLGGLQKIEKEKLESIRGQLDLEKSIIVKGRVTLFLDPKTIVSAAQKKRAIAKFETIEKIGKVTEHIKNILLVDDSKTHREIEGSVLVEAGYNVIFAEDGDEGLEKLAGVDLVITDLEMPRMNGYEFTRALKRINPAIPVIMLTTRSGQNDVAQGLEAGVDEYLVKLDRDELLSAVKRMQWRV